MKPIPIKVEPIYPLQYNYIEWKLHNKCNYDCSFCSPWIKNGTRPGLPLELNKKYVDRISEITGNGKTWISLTGGETTLYPDLIELTKYIKTKPNLYLSMTSNSSRTLRWWTEFRDENTLDDLILTYHGEQTGDYKHIAEVVNLFHDVPINTTIITTHVPKFIDRSIEGYEYLLENTGAIINLAAMAVDNRPSDITTYTDVQLEKLKKYTFLHGKMYTTKAKSPIPQIYKMAGLPLKVQYDDNTLEITSGTALKKNRTNMYKDWDCHIGIKSMFLDITSYRRGMCMIGETIDIDPNDLTTLSFASSTIKCDYDYCNCNMDMYSIKERTK